jgi:hypothetical protein
VLLGPDQVRAMHPGRPGMIADGFPTPELLAKLRAAP